ncbi:MAG: exodeoxyribonuclease V subunit gamma [Planctomycetes bacterium]|nr:exodeoxyribonuclease V subunit gamma [Planctomycetota bacterium]
MCIFIHMGTLYLAADLRALADRLGDELERQAKHGDFFVPASIVVPNRFVKKWLRLWLARRLHVAINLKFQNLEESLWELLKALDPAAKASPPETVEDSVYFPRRGPRGASRCRGSRAGGRGIWPTGLACAFKITNTIGKTN